VKKGAKKSSSGHRSGFFSIHTGLYYKSKILCKSTINKEKS